MEGNKLDQLFREKLSGSTSVPSPQAWDDLEVILDKKKKKAVFWYYKIAASIVLLLACGLVTYQIFIGKEESMPIVKVDINYHEMESQQRDIVELDNNTMMPPEVIIEGDIIKIDSSDLLGNETLVQGNEKTKSDPIEGYKKDNSRFLEESDSEIVSDLMVVDLQEEDDLDDVLAKVEDNQNKIIRKNPKSVTITYKASKKKVNNHRVVITAKLDTAKRRRPDLKDILRFPGHLLADVRDAKDYLFNPKSEMSKTKSEN